MKMELESALKAAVQELFGVETKVELTRPEEKFGDYATNVALQLVKQVGKNPREIAEAITVRLADMLPEQIDEISVAGPGFLNVRLTDQALLKAAEAEPARTLEGKVVVAEYSDPNPFKVLHAGHLYTSIVGNAIANLFDLAGAETHRVNFGGDVGLHVAKTLWAVVQEMGGAHPEKLNDIPENEHAEWLANAYIRGTQAYADSEEGKTDIQTKLDIQLLNKIIYDFYNEDRQFAGDTHKLGSGIHVDVDKLQEVYEITRRWSYEYFDAFYARIGTPFEKYYPESQTAGLGLKTVREHIGEVYQESDGAVIFDGEKYGLHTRVFINSEGLPTYETKDVGLIMLKKQDYNFDRSVVITGNEQEQYMAVVLKSIEQFAPELVQATSHLTHGLVKLKGGVKMSSRKGNILRAVDVLDVAAEANRTLTGQDSEDTIQGAVKYAFLKNRMGGDIIYDPEESVSLEGNSGPYLQYAHARARSILRKATGEGSLDGFEGSLQPGERTLLRKISEYPEIVDKAVADLMPHHICTYLYELAQTFNRFYEQNRVIGDEREALRLGLVTRYADTLKKGLSVLGIASPEKM